MDYRRPSPRTPDAHLSLPHPTAMMARPATRVSWAPGYNTVTSASMAVRPCRRGSPRMTCACVWLTVAAQVREGAFQLIFVTGLVVWAGLAVWGLFWLIAGLAGWAGL